LYDPERLAWAGLDIVGESEFFFDGIHFWRRNGAGLDAREGRWGAGLCVLPEHSDTAKRMRGDSRGG